MNYNEDKMARHNAQFYSCINPPDIPEHSNPCEPEGPYFVCASDECEDGYFLPHDLYLYDNVYYCVDCVPDRVWLYGRSPVVEVLTEAYTYEDFLEGEDMPEGKECPGIFK